MLQAVAGVAADGRQIVNRCRDEAVGYKRYKNIPNGLAIAQFAQRMFAEYFSASAARPEWHDHLRFNK